MAASSAVYCTSSKSNEKGNGLLLYFHHYSFYAQKVIMAMAEKKLSFKPHIVDITRGEQYQPWFLEINPRGEVPVLVDGVKTIPDSARIIDYLEDNFSNASIALYGAFVWARALQVARTKNRFEQVQRRMALRVCSAYHTVSGEEEFMIAGLQPLVLLVKEREDIRRVRKTASTAKITRWLVEMMRAGKCGVLDVALDSKNRSLDNSVAWRGDAPRLIPTDLGSQIKQKVEHFRSIVDQLPANVITMGSFLHPELSPNPKLPFIAPVRRQLSSSDEKASEKLRSLAEQHPNMKDILLRKAEAHDHNRAKITTKEGYEKLLKEVDTVLIEIEKELETHKGDTSKWLCTDRFTIADIALTILLDRLYLLGLESYFWTNGKKPSLEEYYNRVRQRESYKQTVPSNMFHLKTFLEMQSRLFVGLSVGTLLASLLGGIVYYKKK